MICWFSSKDYIGPLNATVCGRDLLFAIGAKRKFFGNVSLSKYSLFTSHFRILNES